MRQQGDCHHDYATDSVGLGAASGSSAGAQGRPTSAQGGHSGSSGAGPASSAGLGGEENTVGARASALHRVLDWAVEPVAAVVVVMHGR